jgi:hypothetical protein
MKVINGSLVITTDFDEVDRRLLSLEKDVANLGKEVAVMKAILIKEKIMCTELAMKEILDNE